MAAQPEGAFAAALRRREATAIDALLAAVILPTSALVPRPWGGDAIARHTSRAGVPEPIGESFELAAAPSDPEAAAYPSAVILPDGDRMPLHHVLHACPEILGEAHLLAFGHELPLLPKLLDVQSMLSVQAHPAGAPELYVILDAAPGATLHLGLREDTDRDAFVARLERGAALQRAVTAAIGDRPALARAVSTWLLGDPLAPLDPTVAGDCEPFAATLDELRHIGIDVLSRMHALKVTAGMVVHNCVPHPDDGRPSATLHALGNPRGLAVLALEVRLVGPTYRAWDHGRLPARALDIEAAIANVPMSAQRKDDFVLAHDLRDIAIDNGVFTVERMHVAPTAPIDRSGRGRAEVVHVCSGTIEVSGGRDTTVHPAGTTLLVPATWSHWRIGATSPASVVVASVCPRATALATRTVALRRVREIVARDEGPRDVLAIANGGDAPVVTARLEAERATLFRSDGATRITVHEEPTRRGQLLGMLDAVRGWSPQVPDEVALGIMLPGQGTRLSPVTQRLHGIKPFVPMPIRARADGPWMSAGAASLHSWVLVADALRRAGFAGIAWKWGDEPQLPSTSLAALALDLRAVDAVRFGKRTAITEDLARNKEWLLSSADGRLVAQVRRRPADALRERLAGAGADAHALVHIGSPALSHRFIAALAHGFGDVAGWLDIDGYLFEALTHDPAAWQREVQRDAGLRAMLAGCPDFYARAHAVKDRLEAERGTPLSIRVIDCGADTWWGDMGQLGSAHAAFARLALHGSEGELARRLAMIADVVPDRFGNRIVDADVPHDGSVRDSVILQSWIGAAAAVRGAVVLGSEIGDANLDVGAVVIDSTVAELDAGAGAWVFRTIAARATVAPGRVHTTMPSDPRQPAGALEQWAFDMREDPSTAASWSHPIGDNPRSFHEKALQMRQRDRPLDDIDAEIERCHRAPLAARIRSVLAPSTRP